MEDFDIQEFAKMFDAALASDNPAVQKALRNFIMVSALVHSQENADELTSGPFETLLKQIDDLQRRVSRVESERYSTQTYPNPYDNSWIYNIPTTTGIKDWKYNSSSLDEYSVDIEKYLKDAIKHKGTS